MTDESALARAEWRAEEEEWTRAALERWEHGRGLADVLRDCGHRGDVVTFVFPNVAWSGFVVVVGDDVARVASEGVAVDVHFTHDAPFVLRTRRGSGDAARGEGAVTTFTARLRELDGTPVGIGTATGALEGRLRVGRDQLRLTDPDGGVAHVPTGSVWWVRPLADD